MFVQGNFMKSYYWCDQFIKALLLLLTRNTINSNFIIIIFCLITIFFYFFFFFKPYIIVLVLPNIKMNPPQVYMCSPSWTPSLLPPHTLPLGGPSAPAPSIQHRALNLDWHLVSYMTFHMFHCHSPKSSHPLPLPQSP